MNCKALKELERIMKIEGVDRKSGRLARELALNSWIYDWVVDIEESQSIIKGSLTSEEDDFIKYHMATVMGEKLMDDCISVQVTPNKISTQIKALRR